MNFAMAKPQTKHSFSRSVKKEKIIFLLFFALSFFILSSAQNPAFSQSGNQNAENILYLSDPYDHINILPFARIVGSSPTISKAYRNYQTGRYVENTRGSVLNFGMINKRKWIFVNLVNETDRQDWRVELGSSFQGRFGRVQSFNFYKLNQEPGQVKITRTALDLKKNTLDISLQTGPQEQLIAFEITPEGGIPLTLPFYLHTVHSHDYQISAFPFAIFGGLVLLLGGFLILGFVSHNRIAILCHGTALTISLVALVVIILKPDGLDWISYDAVVLNFAILLFSILGAGAFFDATRENYNERYILYGLLGFLIFSILGFFVLFSQYDFLKSFLVFLTSTLTLSILGFLSLSRFASGNAFANLYATGWFIQFAGLFITCFAMIGLLPSDILKANIYWITTFLQNLFFIAAFIKAVSEESQKNRRSGVAIAAAIDPGNIKKIRETKEAADYSRLLKVIKRERETLNILREKEAKRTKEMERAKEEADAANRAKSSFLAVVSHEIRTPMNGILGMTNLLLKSGVSKEQKDYVTTIQESADSMVGLLNDILDFEKIEQGKMSLETIVFDLHRLVNAVITLMSGHAVQKNIKLVLDLNENTPQLFEGDPTRIRQVLLNLISNAIKFTEKGSVTLRIRRIDDAEFSGSKEETTQIYFGVEDTGIGIPKEKQKKLFDPFSQMDESINRKFGGTGLGLAISRGIVQTMGSTINVVSNENKGSTFFFTLNLKQRENYTEEIGEQDQSNPASTSAAPMKILVVDDNVINIRVIEGYLKNSGHEIVRAESGEEALEILQGNSEYDLILMDIQLSGMQGDETAQTIHSLPGLSDLPIIALTGNVMPSDIEGYYKSGMVDVLEKPISPEKLQQAIAKIAAKDDPEKEEEEEEKALSLGEEEAGEEKKEKHEKPEENIAFIDSDEDGNFEGDFEDSFEQIKMGQQKEEEEGERPEQPLFDKKSIETLRDTIGKEQIVELLEGVIEKTDEIFSVLKDSTEKKDWLEVRLRAHELKGMAGNFGFARIADLSKDLEKISNDDEQKEALQVIERLQNAIHETKEQAKAWMDQD